MHNKMKYYLFSIVLICFFSFSCQSKKPSDINWETLLNEAFKIAIIDKKLPEVDVFIQKDSIYIFPQKAFSSNKLIFDSSLVKDLPKIINNYKLIVIDKEKIEFESSKNNISFIMVSRNNIQNVCVIQFSKENYFPEQDMYIMIDKGILKVIFKFKNDKWQLEKILDYYG